MINCCMVDLQTIIPASYSPRAQGQDKAQRKKEEVGWWFTVSTTGRLLSHCCCCCGSLPKASRGEVRLAPRYAANLEAKQTGFSFRLLCFFLCVWAFTCCV